MKQNTLLVVLLVAFLVIPFLPKQILYLSDSILVRIPLLLGFLYFAMLDPILGIVALTVVAFIFIQRNKLKVDKLVEIMSQSTQESPAVQSIVTPETAPAQPDFDIPLSNRWDVPLISMESLQEIR